MLSRPGPQPWREKRTLRLWPGAALSGPRTSWTVSCSGYRSKRSQMAGTGRVYLPAPWTWQGRAQEGWATGERQGPPPQSARPLASQTTVPLLPCPAPASGDKVVAPGQRAEAAREGGPTGIHLISNIPTQVGRAAPGS